MSENPLLDNTLATSPASVRSGDHCCSCNSCQFLHLYSAPDFDGQGDTYSLNKCEHCGLVVTAPEPCPEKLKQAYAQDYYGAGGSKFVQLIECWTTFSARKRATQLIRLHGSFEKKLRVLDIGCGRGVLLNAFRAMGHDVVGVERVDSPFEGVPDVICGELTEVDLEPGSFDIVVLWHVLEHVHNPKAVLNTVARLVNKNGSLFIAVPNFASNQARLFKKAWFHLDLPRHLFHFTPGSLSTLLTDCGFSVSRQSTFSIDQNAYGFLQSALNTIPGLKNNHLYELLKKGFSSSLLCWLIIYIPLAGLISVVAAMELLISELQQKGASLTVKAVIKKDA